MRITALVLAIPVLIALVAMGSTPSGPVQEPGPTFDDKGRLLTPEGWQKWVLAGSSLGLGYTPRTRGDNPGTFKHVYINPGSFDHYVRTGEGDPEVYLTGLYFWTGRTEAVLEMIQSNASALAWRGGNKIRIMNRIKGRPMSIPIDKGKKVKTTLKITIGGPIASVAIS